MRGLFRRASRRDADGWQRRRGRLPWRNEARPRLPARRTAATLLVPRVALSAAAAGYRDSPRYVAGVVGHGGAGRRGHDGPTSTSPSTKLIAKRSDRAGRTATASPAPGSSSTATPSRNPSRRRRADDDFADPARTDRRRGGATPHGRVVLWSTATRGRADGRHRLVAQGGGTLRPARPDGSSWRASDTGAGGRSSAAASRTGRTTGRSTASDAGAPNAPVRAAGGPSAPDAPPDAVPAAAISMRRSWARPDASRPRDVGEALASLRRGPGPDVPATPRYDGAATTHRRS